MSSRQRASASSAAQPPLFLAHFCRVPCFAGPPYPVPRPPALCPPPQIFAPFVDATLYPTPQLLDFHAATGQKWYTLAFITAGRRRAAASAAYREVLPSV